MKEKKRISINEIRHIHAYYQGRDHVMEGAPRIEGIVDNIRTCNHL